MTTLGYEVINDPISADIYLSIDFDPKDISLLSFRKKTGKYNVLFRNEPKCVLPEGYKSKAINLNHHIITFGKFEETLATEVWPQFWESSTFALIDLFRNSSQAVVINANKLNLTKNELYRLRRECLKKLANLELYGTDWNSSIKSRFKVVIIEILKRPVFHLVALPRHSRFWFNHWPITQSPSNKDLVLRKYKVSLVIENESSYMSEKLFDALSAGCIVVYVGPNLAKFSIPPSLIYQAEPNLNSIKSKLEHAFVADYEKYLDELQKWLGSSDVISRFRGEKVMSRALHKSIQAHTEFKTMSKR